MARHFQSSASEYLTKASAVLTAVPLTMACWFFSYDTAPADDQVLIDLHNSASARFRDCYQLIAGGFSTAIGPVTALSASSISSTQANASVNWRPLIWQHATAVFSSTDGFTFMNGTFKGNIGAAPEVPVGINTTTIGRATSTAQEAVYLWGRIAHAAIWSAALEDAEVSMLAQGYLPPQIRPDALQAYWPLNNASAGLDVWGGFHLTPTGTRMATDPPQLYKQKPMALRLPLQAPASGSLMGQILM